jgi:tryptophan halogenase
LNIVIVGGGTAGWLSALMISKTFKQKHKITIIESESIGTIGVGESSTGFLRGVVANELYDYGCDELEFMKQTKAMPKYGILFKEWDGLNKDYMEPTDGPLQDMGVGTNSLISYLKANDLDISLSSINGNLMKNNFSSFYKYDGKIFSESRNSYNFDSKGAGDYFKKICSDSVEKIVGEVVDINLNSDGFVTSVLMSSGKIINGDFFIDASGFSRIFSKKMGIKFIEYKDLTVNSAITFKLDYEYLNNQKLFYTISWAQKFGWMWMIPRADFVWCGYIYDNNYINESEAKYEIEEKLKTKIEVVRTLKFNPGRLEKTWNKNVLSIGLSSSFLEPLEATSIHGTIAQLNSFIYMYLEESLEKTVTTTKQDVYNEQNLRMVENFRSFILLHYTGSRRDTKFWENINKNALNNELVKKIINISKSRLITQSDLGINSVYGGAGEALFNYVLCAFNHFSSNTAYKELNMFGRLDTAKDQEKNMNKYLNNKDWITNEDFFNLLNSN